MLTCPVSAEEAGYAVTITHCRACWLGSGLTLQGLSGEGTKPWPELLRWSVCYFCELKRQNAALGEGDGDGNWTVSLKVGSMFQLLCLF